MNNIKLSVSPNPASNEIVVNANNSIGSVEIYNISGKRIYNKQQSNSYSLRIPISHFSDGPYIVKTTVQGEINSTKILIKH